MSKTNIQLEKILKQPIAQKILRILVEEELTVWEISEKIQNIDIQKIIAFLAELQRLGLIIPSSKELKEPDKRENKKNLEIPDEIIHLPHHEWFTPLGLSIPEYNALWDETGKKDKNIENRLLERMKFTLPEKMKEYIKKKE